MKYEVRFTNQCKKDYRASKRHGKNLEKLHDLIEVLANGESLDPEKRNHALIGKYKDCRRCHVEPDWLLAYEIFSPQKSSCSIVSVVTPSSFSNRKDRYRYNQKRPISDALALPDIKAMASEQTIIASAKSINTKFNISFSTITYEHIIQ